MLNSLDRRHFLKFSSMGALFGSLGGLSLARTNAAPTQPSFSKKGIRVIHMTDSHLMDDFNALEGSKAAYSHALTLKPDLIAQGGDLMTHTIAKTWQEAQQDMQTVIDAMPSKNEVPMLHACGNHDIWGWNKPKSGATGDEPHYGKAWFKQTLGEGHLYRAVKLGNWRMILLDSVQPSGNGYRGGLDDEQFSWLQDELAGPSAGKPVCVVSHIPIINIAVMLLDGRRAASAADSDGIRIPKGSSFQDAWRVLDLFHRHGQVKCALSGHVHVSERIDILGTSFISSGAVCGSWWRPADYMAERRNKSLKSNGGLIRPERANPGFGVLDLLKDGNFNYQYINFPWKFVY